MKITKFIEYQEDPEIMQKIKNGGNFRENQQQNFITFSISVLPKFFHGLRDGSSWHAKRFEKLIEISH